MFQLKKSIRVSKLRAAVLLFQLNRQINYNCIDQVSNCLTFSRLQSYCLHARAVSLWRAGGPPTRTVVRVTCNSDTVLHRGLIIIYQLT